MLYLTVDHLPVILPIMGGMLLLAAPFLTRSFGCDSSSGLLVLALIASVPTVVMGFSLAPDHRVHAVEDLATFSMLGIATMVVSLLATLLHRSREQVLNADVARNLFFVMAAMLAGSTGLMGGQMMYGVPAQVVNWGTGPAGAHLVAELPRYHAH